MTTQDMIHFEDWEKIDLRVGKVLEVEDHPQADKLLILKVDFGDDIGEKTIVAGLKNYCTKEHLKNKSAIFIINLEERELRGVKSQGMILATISHDKTKACIITPEETMQPGTKVS